MMYCEICGAEIKGQVHEIKIEGSELNACDNCVQYEGVSPSKGGYAPLDTPGVEGAKSLEGQGRDVSIKKVRRRRDIYNQMIEELVPDFYKIIRKARQAHGWTQEELASMVKERSSLIRKIERGDLLPEDDVRKKLEHVLGIKLTERVMEPRLDVQTPKELTFGEVAVIKRKKRYD
ncbi:MAG: multiprotein bridging factor aMBF1 [Methanocellales archaeon]|nr:multiprotein bridging factor aMBF1 [Methanocellales archaeon]